MNRLLLALLLALISLPAFAASETINQLPAAGTLLQSTPVPVWNGSTTVQTTAGAIAALGASTSGSGIPGGLSTQPQYNNGGSFGGLNEYHAQAYGAKCDGTIINGGMRIRASSNQVCSGGQNCLTGPADQFYSFQTKDVGATITLNACGGGQTNGQGPSAGFTTTIASVSNGVATLTAAPSFSSCSSFGTDNPGGQARFYHTDDSVALQNMLTAAASQNSGMITIGNGTAATMYFPPGVCVAHNLTVYGYEDLKGEGTQGATLMLAANANTDLLISAGYTYFNTNSTGFAQNPGILGIKLENLNLDGNAGANTGSGAGTDSGVGDNVRFFGTNLTMESVYSTNASADNFYFKNNGSGGCSGITNINTGSTGGSQTCMEDYFHNIYSTNATGYGFAWNGPHDSVMDTMWLIGNSLGGFIAQDAGTHTETGWPGNYNLWNVHAYQNGTASGSTPFPNNSDFILNQGQLNCYACNPEGTVVHADGNVARFYMNSAMTVIKEEAGGLDMNNSFVVGALNNQEANNGGQDIWFKTPVGSLTGNPYKPQNTFASTGFAYQGVNSPSSNPFTLQTCSGSNCGEAYAMSVTTSGSLLFAETTTAGTAATTFMAFDPNQNIAAGPSALAGATTGAGVDFHYYSTSSNSSMVLPGGSTAARPVCSGALLNAIRSNTSIGAIEICNGNGTWAPIPIGNVSLAVPNIFTAGQSVVPVTPTPATLTFTPNLAAGNTFIVDLVHSTSNVLANPANFVSGQSGLIYVIQSGSGGDTFGGGYGSQYVVSGGTFPTLRYWCERNRHSVVFNGRASGDFLQLWMRGHQSFAQLP